MSEIVYEVLTEFVFDTREAISNSETLRGAVDKISSAADGALFSLNRLGEWASHGLGLNLSVMGTLGAALHSFEKFSHTRLNFANIIGSNMENLTGNVETFNDRLAVSQNIMKDIAGIARKYSLDESAMVHTTEMLSALLTPMGLSGKNMGNAVNMSRMFEKSAPVLGIDTGQAQGELVRLLSGQASMGDTLFRRLVSDTKPFAQYRSMMQNPMMMMHHMGGMGGGGPSQMFNMLPMQKRWEMINKAMEQFSSDADVVAGNAGLLSSKLRAIKNELIGIDGILIPFGKVLTDQIRPILQKVMGFLETYGRPALEKFSVALQNVFANPERLYASIRQLQRLRSDLPKAISLMHAFDTVLFGLWIAKLPVINTALRIAATSLASLGRVALSLANISLEFTSVLGILRTGFTVTRFLLSGLAFVMGRLILPLAAFLGILQLISRAKGFAEAEDLKAMAAQAPKVGGAFAELTKNLFKVIKPIDDVIDTVARAIAPIFEWNKYLSILSEHMDLVVSVTDAMHTGVVAVIAVLTGIGVVMIQWGLDVWKAVDTTFHQLGTIIFDWSGKIVTRVKDIFDAVASGNVGKAVGIASAPLGLSQLPKPDIMSPKDLINLYNSTVDSVLKENVSGLNDPNKKDKNVTNRVTNIGNVNIRQDFKENMEPDRIAHSFMKTINDLAVNPRQAAGRSFSAALTR